MKVLSKVFVYIGVVVLELLATLVALIVNPVLPFFAKAGADGYEHLPNWLKWFDTFDATTDAGWRDGYFVEQGTYTPDNPPPYWKRKWYQIKWLYRNPVYGFSYYVLGIPLNRADWTVTYKKLVDGEYFLAYSTSGHFNVFYEGKWGSYKLGWKVWNYWNSNKNEWQSNADGSEYKWGPELRAPSTFSINPIKALKYWNK